MPRRELEHAADHLVAAEEMGHGVPAHEDAWRAGRTFLVPGFAVVQLLAGVTVGGRLVDPEAGR